MTGDSQLLEMSLAVMGVCACEAGNEEFCFKYPPANAPENGCLEDDSVLLGPGLFSGAMLQGG